MLIGLLAGAHLAAGVGGASWSSCSARWPRWRSARWGCVAALRTGSGEAVQGLFPLFFVFLVLSSANLPRDLLKTGWFRDVATWNPISYLIEGFRSLWVTGWDGTALLRGFAVALAILAIGLLLSGASLRTRLRRT